MVVLKISVIQIQISLRFDLVNSTNMYLRLKIPLKQHEHLALNKC